MMPPPLLTNVRRIKRIGPLQLGKILCILYGIMGLFALPFLVFASFFASQLPAEQRVGVLALGTGFAVMMPILYAGMGFVIGVVGALIYNAIAKWVGGIEVEVE